MAKCILEVRWRVDINQMVDLYHPIIRMIYPYTIFDPGVGNSFKLDLEGCKSFSPETDPLRRTYGPSSACRHYV